jgi:hypothetical protein
VKNLSLIQLPSTSNERMQENIRKGKGTGDPGLGTQAVFYELIS